MATLDLGKLKVVFKGTWSSSTAYTPDDSVTYTDAGTLSTYICILSNTNQIPSTGGTANSTYWRFMAKGTAAEKMSWAGGVRTGNFSAQAETGYYVDTTTGAITITLPASPITGQQISIVDYAKTFHNNFVTLNRNGNKIENITEDYVLFGKGTDITLTYSGAATGWVITTFSNYDISNFGDTTVKRGQISKGIGSKKYMIATSDAEEVYMVGDDIVHKFLTSGSFQVHSLGTDATYGDKIRYLAVGGGGSGGTGHAAGGGAGGYRANAGYLETVATTTYTITVGTGGGQRTQGNNHGNGGGSTVIAPATGATFTYTSGGGGGGGSGSHQGQSGGSGGGAGHSSNHGSANGQGTGHQGGNHSDHCTGGGGGAGQRGGDHYGNHEGGHGGIGIQNNITGRPLWYAGGGGGTSHGHTSASSGGLGGGGMGAGGAAEPNTGGGGGGCVGQVGNHHYGGAGGDGIVIIRYRARD
jgi:hypothetical protein